MTQCHHCFEPVMAQYITVKMSVKDISLPHGSHVGERENKERV